MTLWDEVAIQIGQARGRTFTIRSRESVGGGCINQACRIGDGNTSYFVKLNDAALIKMFAAEAEGLNEILTSGTLRAPQPVCWGQAQDQGFLALEYLPLGGRNLDDARLGRQLADMHRFTRAQYGWHRDNTIGSTPQSNTLSGNWIDFWRHQRLGFQLELAARNGFGGALQDKGAKLLAGLDAFFATYTPPASLLHGDLWSGNYGALANGEPVIFDPAVYFGDRETDIAMTELFGGFSATFYAAYQEAYPLDGDYKTRKTLYNLYHILNHANLFGGGYVSQASSMIERLLSQI